MNSKSNQTSDENNLIIEPPLTWSVNSIQIVWSVGQEASITQHTEFIYNSEQSKGESVNKSRTREQSSSSSKNSSSVSRVDTGINFSLNPFTLFGLLSTRVNASPYMESRYNYDDSQKTTNTKLWSESEKNEVSHALSSAFSQNVQQTISNQRLVFTVDFVNHTKSRLFFNSQSANTIPVYCGDIHIGDAHLINLNANTTIAATRKPIPCQFEMELNDTRKQCLLDYRPRIQVESGQLLIQSAPSANEQYDDVIQDSNNISNYFTVAILFKDQVAEWKIRYNKNNPVKLSQALEAINEYIRDFNNDDNKTVFVIKNSRLKSVCGIPFIDDDKSELIANLNVIKSLESQTVNDPDKCLSEAPRRGERYIFRLTSQVIQRLQNDSQKGIPSSQYSLGLCYANGDGVIQDLKEAVNLYRQAAEQGYAEAQSQLGYCYAHGEGVPQDNKEAVKWYHKAAEQGNAEAQSCLGYCYSKGEGVIQDIKKAVKLYRQAAKQGNAEAQFHLAECYAYGDGVVQDNKEAVTLYRQAAEQGYTLAQKRLCDIYALSSSVLQDIKGASFWIHPLAEQGYVPAQFLFGVCYHHGIDVTQNKKEAVKWYRLAADQGFAPAQCALGSCYKDGDGVDKDEKEAVKQYRLAAEQGYPQAQFNLGKRYSEGIGVTKNMTEAVKWYQLAADQGYAEAQYTLGCCYTNGEGVAKNSKKAFNLYKLAAEQGHAWAQLNLSNCYQNGIGVAKDENEAAKWRTLAIKNGLGIASLVLDWISLFMKKPN